MRIIAGELKGRRLASPLDESVRPTADKVKEAMFSTIAYWLPDAVAVDLFAGTGNLGLEALSRGAKHVYFGDNSRESLNLVKENVKHCGVGDRCTIIAGDFRKVLERINQKADIFFLDPPYKEGLLPECFDEIAALGLLAEDGIIVAEHAREDEFPEEYAGFRRIKEKNYGKISFSVYTVA